MQPPSTTGEVAISITNTAPPPSGVNSITVMVTGDGISSGVPGTLTLNGGVWTGTVLNVPAGTGRVVTAHGFAAPIFPFPAQEIYRGETTNVAVLAGTLTSVHIVLKPYPDGGTGIVNTPPVFVQIDHPAGIDTGTTAPLVATASDPDAVAVTGTQALTFTWTATPSGIFTNVEEEEQNVFPNQHSGDPVAVNYTPPSTFTGFAIITVSVFDGTATTTTSFPLAVGHGLLADIGFDVLPRVEVTVANQLLMPSDTTKITYTLTNEGGFGVASPLHVTTAWSSDCGAGSDDDVLPTGATEDVFFNTPLNTPVSRTVDYITTSTMPEGQRLCHLTLTVADALGVEMKTTMAVWIVQPMAVFVSSTAVAGDYFAGDPSAADTFCQDLATNHPATVPAGRYVAWLSFNGINAADRLMDGPFMRADGTPIARNKAELLGTDGDNSLRNAISTDDTGDTVAVPVFTGSNSDGTLHASDNCLNWTSNLATESGEVGTSSAATPNWTTDDEQACDLPAHVYCIQQPALLH